MAARIRQELGAEARLVPGRYGEFTVLVDGEVVTRAGRWGFLGVLPEEDEVLREVSARLGGTAR